MKNNIPIALIYTRLVIGPVLVVLSALSVENYRWIAIALLTIGLLTDIFDGIVARKLNIATQQLRRLDSNVDQVFFVSIAIATYIQCPVFFESNALKLAILIGFEVLAYLICFLKFKKEIATHSIGAKIWTLFLFATLVQVILQCQSVVLFNLCFWIGLATRIEIIAIVMILKKWTNDVPTFIHAIQLRNGREIKRNKMFN
jgi:phosphatidylglycerophosphate synthase